MIIIENTVLPSPEQWERIIMGTRNPMNSWDKSDSKICRDSDYTGCQYIKPQCFFIGVNDLDLMKRLSIAGNDHSKFLRMIIVYADITAPLYWWKEFDTYKVGTVRNSCSTMHKIQSKEFTIDDFSIEHMNDDRSGEISNVEWFEYCLNHLNKDRRRFLETKDKNYWWQMIQLLPASYNQKSTVMLNYQVLKNMYHSRKNHKLDEWHTFCSWIESLPYAKELIMCEV